MNPTDLFSTAQPPTVPAALEVAHCTACGGWSFPATVPGCRQCGAPAGRLQAQPCGPTLRLLNFVTVHAPLAPGLQLPAVIGEIALAPGLVEEARIDVADEGALALGMELVPAWQAGEGGSPGSWVFRPVNAEAQA